jgi:hypothetical protein
MYYLYKDIAKKDRRETKKDINQERQKRKQERK